jgi:phage tail protein X
MSTRYITREEDMLDAIAARFYGYEHGTTEAILAANHGLADLPPRLPTNLVIELPDLPPAPLEPRRTVNLWD